MTLAGAGDELKSHAPRVSFTASSRLPHTQWKAELCHLGKRLYLGTWGTEEEAARAYDVKCRALGLFSRLNFPEEQQGPAAALAAGTSPPPPAARPLSSGARARASRVRPRASV